MLHQGYQPGQLMLTRREGEEGTRSPLPSLLVTRRVNGFEATCWSRRRSLATKNVNGTICHRCPRDKGKHATPGTHYLH